MTSDVWPYSPRSVVRAGGGGTAALALGAVLVILIADDIRWRPWLAVVASVTGVIGVLLVALAPIMSMVAARILLSVASTVFFVGVVLAGDGAAAPLAIALAGFAVSWFVVFPVSVAGFLAGVELVLMVVFGVAAGVPGEVMTASALGCVATVTTVGWAVSVAGVSEIDALTGLPTRRRLDWSLAGLKGPGAVAVVDLDGFKRVNDQHGHAHGDLVLGVAATALRRDLPTGWSVYRTGGDEFVVVAPAGVADGVRDALRSVIDSDVRWQASIGVAEFGGPVDHDAALRAADAALYADKRSRPTS